MYKEIRQFLEQYKQPSSGLTRINGESLRYELYPNVERLHFKVWHTSKLEEDPCYFQIQNQGVVLSLKGYVTNTHTEISIQDNRAERYSTGFIDSMSTSEWTEEENYFTKIFPRSKENTIYDFTGTTGKVRLRIKDTEIELHQNREAIIIRSLSKLRYADFAEVCYNTMVVCGLITGRFVQEQAFTFIQGGTGQPDFARYKFRNLRPSHSSVFEACTHNPYGYKHFLTQDVLDQIAESKTDTTPSPEVLERLIELSMDRSEIQYALVLYNEANSNKNSLLIQNNCFFAVLEVLKKFIHSEFKCQLPKDYSSKGNIEKYKAILSILFKVSAEEIKTIEKRNVFMHGDIKGIESKEMADIMKQQLTLIYKIILSYVGYDGYIIDHYAMRNSIPKRAFVRLNQQQKPID